ncbi:peptidoglycan-binding domain-containing protein [Fodinicola feengrottensis]|uniref:peptidoglycan-binding domain-containing protein n=1 Tax=Fodinicola feengrottensis TaxID=435914 RepID=UPI0024424444|nr:peptidoglycan-binding domain-containing protein [Fodinicola feengrottensis]
MAGRADRRRRGPRQCRHGRTVGFSLANPTFHPAAAAGTGGYALLTAAAHQLGHATETVRANVVSRTPAGTGVQLDVRGQTGQSSWTEWTPADAAHPARWDRPVTAVQARLTLTSNGQQKPSVSAVSLAADPALTKLAAVPAAAPVTSTVFATREGLVGGTTSNGHVITSNDHFVALPSGRGLSPKGTTTYSVHICNPGNGKCVTAPVWDVGPWNTKDDYWNPASQRQSWTDLPQGKPEAQAAYQNGYNGGHDQFGRKVSNPAGIDLADGTFRSDLGLADNGWVNVTYLWTSGTPAVNIDFASYQSLTTGSTGDQVKAVQFLLAQQGHDPGGQDGVFGANTATAVKQFQTAVGLSASGSARWTRTPGPHCCPPAPPRNCNRAPAGTT